VLDSAARDLGPGEDGQHADPSAAVENGSALVFDLAADRLCPFGTVAPTMDMHIAVASVPTKT
jgi:hypothetical protein